MCGGNGENIFLCFLCGSQYRVVRELTSEEWVRILVAEYFH